MTTIRIIPCLDVQNCRVVKGVSFNDLKECGDIGELAQKYFTQGADELVILDIAATPRQDEFMLKTLSAVTKRIFIPVCAGGGIRSIADVRAVLRSGADKVSICSAALNDPALITGAAKEFGSQCVVVSIDARRSNEGWQVYGTGGRNDSGRDVLEWAKEAQQRGAGEILLNSIDNDGMCNGYDLQLIDEVRKAVHIPIIASGGGGTPESVYEAIRAGADAVLAASIFHNERYTVGDIKNYLRTKGVCVR